MMAEGSHRRLTEEVPMLKARLGKEAVLKLRNEVGVLNAITKMLAEKGLDVLAVTTWVEGEQAVIRLVTDDTVRTLDTLRAMGFEAREADVVLAEMPHNATALTNQATCLVALGTANNDHAVVLLNT
jgi:hypothetical protein